MTFEILVETAVISYNADKSQVFSNFALGVKSEPGVMTTCFEASLVYTMYTGKTETLSKSREGASNKMLQWVKMLATRLSPVLGINT